MNTADIKVWKELLSQLQSTVSQNDVVIDEIREEVRLQQQRNKQEIRKLAAKIAEQSAALEALLAELNAGDLFSLPSDQETLESFRSSLQERLEASRMLVSYTGRMLDSKTTDNETMEKIRVGKRDEAQRTAGYVPRHFRQDLLLGNWIHHFSDQLFTCQSFWQDGTFKEYDFKDGSLIEEREGTYTVEDDRVYLSYEEGKKHVYTVTDFSDDFVDYLIEGTPVKFDYMPENLLNSFLENPVQIPDAVKK